MARERFAGFLGNGELKESLSAALDSGRFPHGVILEGEGGLGKRTLAGLIAKNLVCENPQLAPCGACPGCRMADARVHPDILEIRGSGKTASLDVGAVETLTQEASRIPDRGDRRVFLVFLGRQPGTPAQNKLLKLLEEPPGGATFLLLCDSASLLLGTIRSRAMLFRLSPLSMEEAIAFARQRLNLDEEAARRLSRLCGGNPGRMLSEGEEGAFAAARSSALAIASAMLAPGEDELLRALAPLQNDRELCRDVLFQLGLIFRDACVLRAGGKALLSGAGEEADRLADLPREKLLGLPQLTQEFLIMLDRHLNAGLILTGLAARLREAANR